MAGHEATIRESACLGCGRCAAVCRYGAVVPRDCQDAPSKPYRIDPLVCEGCGVCVRACPIGAIDFIPKQSGEWFLSETRYGPMVHARLGVAAENSGKLVSLVRNQARQTAQERGLDTVLVDGPPGIGCPVIAAVTGASLVLVVTEPTLSGVHDLKRVTELTRHFAIPTVVCINKWDLSTMLTMKITNEAYAEGIEVIGKIPYDHGVTQAQLSGLSVVESGSGPLAESFTGLWSAVYARLAEQTKPALSPSNVRIASVEIPSGRKTEANDATQTSLALMNRKDTSMRIAIPTADGKLVMHFGHCGHFTLIDVDPQSKTILKQETVAAPEHEPGLFPRWLAGLGATVIIAGGMGGRARDLFANQQIEVIIGAPAESPEQLVRAYLDGNLVSGENICDH